METFHVYIASSQTLMELAGFIKKTTTPENPLDLKVVYFPSSLMGAGRENAEWDVFCYGNKRGNGRNSTLPLLSPNSLVIPLGGILLVVVGGKADFLLAVSDLELRA